jgi:hypothetical protein
MIFDPSPSLRTPRWPFSTLAKAAALAAPLTLAACASPTIALAPLPAKPAAAPYARKPRREAVGEPSFRHEGALSG